MVFGTTYCAISHLPIEDGDKCMLLPLGFNMKYDFDRYNEADMNSFMFLYNFVYEAQEVTYEGNPDEIKYHNKKYENLAHQLYMLIHYDFYHAIQEEYMKESTCFESIDRLPLFKTCEDIWKNANEIAKKHRDEINSLVLKDPSKAVKKEAIKLFMEPIPVPQWIKEIYKIAMFMDGIGLTPSPTHVVDQHERNILYEKLRSDCLLKNKKR